MSLTLNEVLCQSCTFGLFLQKFGEFELDLENKFSNACFEPQKQLVRVSTNKLLNFFLHHLQIGPFIEPANFQNTIGITLIQVYRSKHSISETQVMEQCIFSFGIKEQLIVMLQKVNDVEQKSAPALQWRLVYM